MLHKANRIEMYTSYCLMNKSPDLVGKSGIDAKFQTVGDYFPRWRHTPDDDASIGRQQLGNTVIKRQRELVTSFRTWRRLSLVRQYDHTLAQYLPAESLP